MRANALFLVVAAAGVSASLAVAAPPAGKGKPPTTGVGCRPQVTVVLRGTLATAPGPSGTSLAINVTGTNAHGKAYKSATQPVTVAIDAKTKFGRQGAREQAALVAGDRALVQARICKADLANAATPALTAARVIAHPSS